MLCSSNIYTDIWLHDTIKLGRFLSKGDSGAPGEGKLVSKQDFNSCGRYTMVLTNALRFDPPLLQLALLGCNFSCIFNSWGVRSTGINTAFDMVTTSH